MNISVDIVDLLAQVSLTIPAASSFQPIFGALRLILERAQILKDDKRKLFNLAVRAASLSLLLHEQVGEHADHLSDHVKSQLDQIYGILQLILSEFNRIDKKPTWRQFFISKSITDKVTDLFEQLSTATQNCQLVLGVDTFAKLTRSSNVVDRTHERVLSIENHLMQHSYCLTEIDPETDLEIVPRRDLCLQKLINTRPFEPYNMRDSCVVIVETFEGIWKDTMPVHVKRFQASARSSARHAFKVELSRFKEVWGLSFRQPRGHSSSSDTQQYIIYYPPALNSRASFPYLLDQCMDSDFNSAIRLLFSLQDFIRRWTTTISLYPFTEHDNKAVALLKWGLWLDSVALDSRMIDSPEDVAAVYEGDLCVLQTASSASDLFMLTCLNWLTERYQRLPTTTTLSNALKVRWNDTDSITTRRPLPISLSNLENAFEESGWRSLESGPSLRADAIEFHVNKNYTWFCGPEYLDFGHTVWDVESECNREEGMAWMLKERWGAHFFNCCCDGMPHGHRYRRIDHLQINWPGTPLDGIEYCSPVYVEGRLHEWQVLKMPSLDEFILPRHEDDDDDVLESDETKLARRDLEVFEECV